MRIYIPICAWDGEMLDITCLENNLFPGPIYQLHDFIHIYMLELPRDIVEHTNLGLYQVPIVAALWMYYLAKAQSLGAQMVICSTSTNHNGS